MVLRQHATKDHVLCSMFKVSLPILYTSLVLRAQLYWVSNQPDCSYMVFLNTLLSKNLKRYFVMIMEMLLVSRPKYLYIHIVIESQLLINKDNLFFSSEIYIYIY